MVLRLLQLSFLTTAVAIGAKYFSGLVLPPPESPEVNLRFLLNTQGRSGLTTTGVRTYELSRPVFNLGKQTQRDPHLPSPLLRMVERVSQHSGAEPSSRVSVACLGSSVPAQRPSKAAAITQQTAVVRPRTLATERATISPACFARLSAKRAFERTITRSGANREPEANAQDPSSASVCESALGPSADFRSRSAFLDNAPRTENANTRP